MGRKSGAKAELIKVREENIPLGESVLLKQEDTAMPFWIFERVMVGMQTFRIREEYGAPGGQDISLERYRGFTVECVCVCAHICMEGGKAWLAF